MKEYILKNYMYNINKIKGKDERYHTVYIIMFENNTYYIGKHTCKDIDKDNYFCSGKAAISMRDSGVKYTRYILFYLESAIEALEAETNLLIDYTLFNNELCLNCSNTFIPDITGFIIVSKDYKYKIVNPKLLNYYLSQGWIIGTFKVCINNSVISKFIHPDELDEYKSKGWQLGNFKLKISSSDRIFIKKNNKFRYIKKYELDEYKSKGWIVKHNTEDSKVIEKDGKLKRVDKSDIDIYLNDGYKLSSTIKDLIYVTKDKQYKRVKLEELDNYIKDGWIRGNNTSNKIYITNGITEKRIYKDENIENDWKIGRLKKIYLNNGINERRIICTDNLTIDNYIKNGYTIGPLRRSKSIAMLSPRKKIRIIREDKVDLYLSKGYIIIENNNDKIRRDLNGKYRK